VGPLANDLIANPNMAVLFSFLQTEMPLPKKRKMKSTVSTTAEVIDLSD